MLAEVENVSPAWNANWSSSSAGPVPTRRPRCKPGMVGDGIRRFTGERRRPPQTPAASSRTPPRSTSATSTARPTPWCRPSSPSSPRSKPATSSRPRRSTRLRGSHTSALNRSPNRSTTSTSHRPARGRSRAGSALTGFHWLEKDLWVSGLQPDTNAVADQLLADWRTRRHQPARRVTPSNPSRSPAAPRRSSTRWRRARSPGGGGHFPHTDSGTSTPTSRIPCRCGGGAPDPRGARPRVG